MSVLVIHRKVFASLLSELEDLVATEYAGYEKKFEDGQLRMPASVYFGLVESRERGESGPFFGDLLKKIIEEEGLHEQLARRGYNKRYLANAYKAYSGGRSGIPEEWIEALPPSYGHVFLQILGKTWEDLFTKASLSEEELIQQKKYLEEGRGTGENLLKTTYYYLLTYLESSGINSKLEYALAAFDVSSHNQGHKGKVKIYPTDTGCKYKGSYELIGDRHNWNVVQLNLICRKNHRPLIILINKTTAIPFYDFDYLLGTYLNLNITQQNTKGIMLFEAIKETPENNEIISRLKAIRGSSKKSEVISALKAITEIKKSDKEPVFQRDQRRENADAMSPEEKIKKLTQENLKQLSELKKYDKMLLMYYLKKINEKEELLQSDFLNKEGFIAHMKDEVVWWKHQRKLFDLFSYEKNQYFFMYFLSKKGVSNKPEEMQVYLARYKARFVDDSTFVLEGKHHIGADMKNNKIRYIGHYDAKEDGVLHLKAVREDNSDFNYFHFFLEQKIEYDGRLRFEGTYAGWRKKEKNLDDFAGRVLFVSVDKEEYDKSMPELFLIGKHAVYKKSEREDQGKEINWGLPHWLNEVKKHSEILPFLAGKRDIAEDNELVFLPGIEELYRKGFLSEKFKQLQGTYYYYRAKTKPKALPEVKRYLLIIDEYGFLYVKSEKEEKEKIYMGTLMVEPKSGKIIASLYKEDRFAETIIFEDLSKQYPDYPFFRGLYVGLNYFEDIVSGRLYLRKKEEKEEKPDWQSFKEEESPVVFERKDDGTWKKKGSRIKDDSYCKDGILEEADKESAEVCKEEKSILNSLYGQINNVLSFRSNASDLRIRTNLSLKDNEDSLLLARGSYAEDVLRAATVFWKKEVRDEERFCDNFVVGTLFGGYNNEDKLREWFVRDKGMEGCGEALRRYVKKMEEENPFHEKLEELKKKINKLFSNVQEKKTPGEAENRKHRISQGLKEKV